MVPVSARHHDVIPLLCHSILLAVIGSWFKGSLLSAALLLQHIKVHKFTLGGVQWPTLGRGTCCLGACGKEGISSLGPASGGSFMQKVIIYQESVSSINAYDYYVC